MTNPTDTGAPAPGDQPGPTTPNGAAGDQRFPPPMGAATPVPPPPGTSAGTAEAPRARVALGPDGTVREYTPTAPAVGWPQRIWSATPTRLKIILPVVLVFLVVGWWTSRGETLADDLEVGDCFVLPGAEFTEVQDQSCDGPHEAELLAITNLPVGTPWPGAPAAVDVTVLDDACFAATATLTIDFDNVPDDAYFGFFFAASDDWQSSGREIQCYVTSPTRDLPGRVLAG